MPFAVSSRIMPAPFATLRRMGDGVNVGRDDNVSLKHRPSAGSATSRLRLPARRGRMPPFSNRVRQHSPGFMRELLAELTAALDQKRACVYCAVVETRGSTPQKAGAAMLVLSRRQSARHARRRLRRGRSQAASAARAGERRPEARSADVLSRRQLRLGRRTDLRRPHEHPRRSARSLRAATYYRRSAPTRRGRPGCTQAIVARRHAAADGWRSLSLRCPGQLVAQTADAAVSRREFGKD